jgi:hypothetical protein
MCPQTWCRAAPWLSICHAAAMTLGMAPSMCFEKNLEPGVQRAHDRPPQHVSVHVAGSSQATCNTPRLAGAGRVCALSPLMDGAG